MISPSQFFYFDSFGSYRQLRLREPATPLYKITAEVTVEITEIWFEELCCFKKFRLTLTSWDPLRLFK